MEQHATLIDDSYLPALVEAVKKVPGLEEVTPEDVRGMVTSLRIRKRGIPPAPLHKEAAAHQAAAERLNAEYAEAIAKGRIQPFTAEDIAASEARRKGRAR